MSVSGNLCAQIRSLLPDYVDGEIVAVADVARIRAHVANCADCASELAFLRATNFVMANKFPDVHPPVDLLSRIAQATYARPTFRERLLVWLAPQPVRLSLGGAVAAGVVLAVTISVTSRSRQVAEPQLAANRPNATTAAVSAGRVASGRPKHVPAVTAPAVIAEKTLAKSLTPATSARQIASRLVAVDHAAAPLSPSPVKPARAAVALTHAPAVAVLKHEISPKELQDAPLLVPLRDRMLASRGNLDRTLANGSAPQDFSPPTVKGTENSGVVGADSSMPPTADASAPHSEGADQIPTPAQSVVSAPHFKINLFGAAPPPRVGTSTTILAHVDRNNFDLQNGIIPIVKSDLH